MTPDADATAATPMRAPPIWGKVDRAFAVVVRGIELALGLAFLFAVVLNFVTAADRFIFKKSIIGSDEVQVFIMIWMTFVGAAVVTWRHQHLRMDVLSSRFPFKVRMALLAVELVLILVLMVVLLRESAHYTLLMQAIDRRSDLGAMPMWVPHSALCIGFSLIGLITLRARAASVRGGALSAMILTLGVLPIVLLLLGFPVYIVLFTALTVTLVLLTDVPLTALHQNLFGTIDSFALLAVPFFIYAGELMGRGSVAQRLVDFVQEGVGSVRGSLGVTTVGTSAIFGAISGASSACVATVGKVMYPAMRRAGYPEPFAAGLVTAVGAIDIIIPPSVPLIVYGAAAQESVPRLYAAGILPGLLIAGLITLYVIWRAHREKFGKGQPFNLARFGRAFYRGIWALGAPFIILGGIYGGVFSPTEAAAVACIYAALVTRFVFHELTWSDVLAGATSTVLFTAQILIIVACAGVFAWILTIHQVPNMMVQWIQSLNVATWLVLLVINVLLLVIGCFLDGISAILLLSPLLVPIVKSLGVDTVHFGIIMAVNLAIGLFHPPFGINIFVAQSVLGIKLEPIYRGIIPFVFVYLVALGLITYFPQISLIGVKLLMGR
jgi:C4-dicarboxylate transporter DctM subunit